MDGKSQAAVLRGPATPTLAAANASRVLASAPRTDFLLECRTKLPTAARSSYLNRRLCARRHRSQRLAQGAEAVGFAHEAEQAGQRLSCAQHPCFCSRLTARLSITTIPRLTRVAAQLTTHSGGCAASLAPKIWRLCSTPPPRIGCMRDRTTRSSMI